MKMISIKLTDEEERFFNESLRVFNKDKPPLKPTTIAHWALMKWAEDVLGINTEKV